MPRPVHRASAVLAVAMLLMARARAFAADAPVPVVAHVSFVEGTLTLVRRGSPNQSAPLNSPVFAGDELVASSGRAEIEIDDATVIRFAPGARLTIADLQSGSRAMRLEDGTLELRLLRNPADGRVQTPSITMIAEQAGRYRVSVQPDGATLVTVRSGRASIGLPNGGVMTVLADATVRASGSPADPDIAQAPLAASDAFDLWNESRDVALDASVAADRLSPDLAANSLYGYGHWQNDTPYGMAWVPDAEQAGWAPYTLGSWIQTPGFGPAWVGSEPWGWAPYHYGRWIDDPAYGWIWIPDYGSEPGWEPALVGLLPLLVPLLGSPFGPYVGWYPLPPYVAYEPLVVGRTNAHPGFTYAAPNVRFPQRSIVGAPVHFAPPVRMNVPGEAGGVASVGAPVRAPPVRAGARR